MEEQSRIFRSCHELYRVFNLFVDFLTVERLADETFCVKRGS